MGSFDFRRFRRAPSEGPKETALKEVFESRTLVESVGNRVNDGFNYTAIGSPNDGVSDRQTES